MKSTNDHSPVDGNFLATMQSGAHPSRYYVHNALPNETPKNRQRSGSVSPEDRLEIARRHKEAIHSNPVALENFYRDLTYKEKVLKVR